MSSDIGAHPDELSRCRGARGNHVRPGLLLFGGPATDHHRSPPGGQCECNGLPDALRAAGEDGDTSCEIVAAHDGSPCVVVNSLVGLERPAKYHSRFRQGARRGTV